MAENDSLDETDQRILHALQIDGRASYARIAAALDLSERSVSRRYHRLRAQLALRVVAVARPSAGDHEDWFLRIAPARGAAESVARAVAGRAESSWVAHLAGDGSVTCFVRSDATAGQGGVIDQLRRSSGVTSVTAQRVLAPVAGVGGWRGRLAALTPEQVEAMSPGPRPDPPDRADAPSLSPEDRRLVRLLETDGRTSVADLARAARIPESTVRRRVAELTGSGAVMFEVEVAPVLYERRLDALCWLDVRPCELATVSAALASHDEVAYAATTTGTTSIVAILELADAADLDRYLTDRLGALSGIHHVTTDVATRWVKRAGTIVPTRSG